MRLPLSFRLLPWALALLAAPALSQTTWYVDAAATGPGTGTALDPFPAIQTAIDQPATVDGDTVLVMPGTYLELVDLLDKELVLKSWAGAAVTTIDVALQFSLEQSAVKVRGGQGPACRIEGFTLKGGEGTQILEPVQNVVEWCGGGLLAVGSSPTVVDCILRDNTPYIGGGACVIGGSVVFLRCTFLDNETNRDGAALHGSNAVLTLLGSEVSGNRALSGDGGGLHLLAGSLSMVGGTLSANHALVGGSGGHLALRFGASAALVDVSFVDGIADDGKGGAAWIENGSASFASCDFDGHSAGYPGSDRAGGAIAAEGSTLEIVRCTLTGNSSARGGAVFLEDCVATIEDSRFQLNSIRSGSNYFWAEGGAVAARSSTLNVLRTQFERNSAVNGSPSSSNTIARGGALWCDSAQVLVEDCRFLGNEAYYDGWSSPAKSEAGAQGGAVFGPAQISGSQFVGNRAHADPLTLSAWAEGGAVWGARCVSCSFTGNSVDGAGPHPDSGTAAEASLLDCCTTAGNLPASLRPFGPLCVVIPCP